MTSASELQPVSVASTALGRDMAVEVYVPDGPVPAEGWPVLYLLHGHDGNERSWADLGGIQARLDRLIADGTIAPLLVVMPDAGNSWYVDSADVDGPGDYETAITVDLVAHVEANYPAQKSAAGRAIAGLSMGGFGAIRLAYAHPQLYTATASLSGALWNNVPSEDISDDPDDLRLIADSVFFHRIDADTIGTGRILPSTGDHFAGAFGEPFEAARFNAHNVFTLLQQAVDSDVPLPKTYLTAGDDDGFNLWRGAISLHETLIADGRTSELRITDGDHVWSLWSVSIVDVLRFIDAQWVKPAP
nr:alpha/beta hydrolase family protein [Aureimonas mangrovi]